MRTKYALLILCASPWLGFQAYTLFVFASMAPTAAGLYLSMIASLVLGLVVAGVIVALPSKRQESACPLTHWPPPPPHDGAWKPTE